MLVYIFQASAPLRSPRFLFGSKCSPGDDLSSIKRVVFLNSGIGMRYMCTANGVSHGWHCVYY